jgi:hypothetical protein
MNRLVMQRFAVGSVLFLGSLVTGQAQEALPDFEAKTHSDCTMFGASREEFNGQREWKDRWARSQVTAEFWSHMPADSASKSPRRDASGERAAGSSFLIDKYIFAALNKEGIKPAETTNDYEFIRRVTLDLTGRVPKADRVAAFVKDGSPDKREKLVDELLATPEYVDKWTMWMGDFLKNTQNTGTTGTIRQPQGRDAFYTWIKKSLTDNKPWDKMAYEMIAATGVNTWDQGELNWIVNGRMNMGVAQDNFDRSAAQTAETFLGLAHMDCLLCHNGRGHLDALSVWGRGVSRQQAWGMAAYFARTAWRQVRPDATNNNLYYWTVTDTGNAMYPLNRASGNRPDRNPVGTTTQISPAYIFDGKAPAANKPFRQSLADQVVADSLFPKAFVNYLWQHFFGRGIVEPVNQLDPARLDENNVPTDCPEGTPCGLQAPHVPLLNALGAEFAKNNFDIKWLMKQIVMSDAYQLSSRYSGDWNPNWEPLFARHMVRRLWGEEVYDAIAQTSNIAGGFTVNNIRYNWAMQVPETRIANNGFVMSFLPGNRDDEPRRPESAIQQAMSLMNDTFVTTRARVSGTGAAASLAAQVMTLQDDPAVESLYMTVLSRRPTDDEKKAALAHLKGGTRQQRLENLVWSLYNKVDFIFNY